jgi:uncharacterized protein YbcI
MNAATPVVNIGLEIRLTLVGPPPQAALSLCARPATLWPDHRGRKPMQHSAQHPDDTIPPSVGGESPTGGELNAAIARAVVGIHRHCVARGTGRGPWVFHGNIVVVVLEDPLVTAERTLAASGHQIRVIRLPEELLKAMRLDLIAAVERLTDREVTALMGQTNVKPAMASQIFVLGRPIHSQPVGASGDAGPPRPPSRRIAGRRGP